MEASPHHPSALKAEQVADGDDGVSSARRALVRGCLRPLSTKPQMDDDDDGDFPDFARSHKALLLLGPLPNDGLTL